MKPFWDEYVAEVDLWVDSDILNGSVFDETDNDRLTSLCNDIAIGRRSDLFPWPTQLLVPHYCIKDHWTASLN